MWTREQKAEQEGSWRSIDQGAENRGRKCNNSSGRGKGRRVAVREGAGLIGDPAEKAVPAAPQHQHAAPRPSAEADSGPKTALRLRS